MTYLQFDKMTDFTVMFLGDYQLDKWHKLIPHMVFRDYQDTGVWEVELSFASLMRLRDEMKKNPLKTLQERMGEGYRICLWDESTKGAEWWTKAEFGVPMDDTNETSLELLWKDFFVRPLLCHLPEYEVRRVSKRTNVRNRMGTFYYPKYGIAVEYLYDMLNMKRDS